MPINTMFYTLYLEYQDCLEYNKMLKYLKDKYKQHPKLKDKEFKDCEKLKSNFFF